MHDLLIRARSNLWKAQERFKCFPELDVHILGYDGGSPPTLGIEVFYAFNFCHPDQIKELEVRCPFLGCWLETTTLLKVLKREAHWNNLEIGCHILFNRRPNVYMPDVHTLMSFFHA